MNFTVTLAATGSVVIQSELHGIAALVIENSGAGDAYYGDPGVVIDLAGADYGANASTPGSPDIVWGSSVDLTGVRQGMVLSGSMAVAFPATSKVLSVNGNKITMDGNATSTEGAEDCIFTSVLDDTTGITIAAGSTERFSSAWGSRFLQQGMKIYSTDGTTLKIFKRWL